MNEVRRGTEAVRAALAQTVELRRADVAAFRAWLGEQLPRWRRDAVFVQRERMRKLRGAWPALRVLEREQRAAARADEESTGGAALRALEVELRGVCQAVDGLTGALDGAEPDRVAALEAKLASFTARRDALEEDIATATAASPERRELLRVRRELARLRRRSGWVREAARLRRMVRSQGQRSGHSGGGFEAEAVTAVRGHLLPELGADACVLTGVTLGAADLEVDALVVRRGEPAEVLAVVEAKRNANDVGHGFARRQADLAWLAGERGAYDEARRTTRAFPAGHFDRPVVHEQEGERFVLAPASFRRFRRGPSGHYLHGLYFVTRPGALAGLSGGALGRIRHRVATDEDFDPDDPAYLAALLAWCRTLAGPVETPDVLALYAADEATARQILWVG